VREIFTEFFRNCITTIMQIMDQFIDNDPDYEPSCKARRGVLERTYCCRDLLCERILKKRKSTLDASIMKKPRFADDPQPGSSSGV
jgi:hypothetical protein